MLPNVIAATLLVGMAVAAPCSGPRCSDARARGAAVDTQAVVVELYARAVERLLGDHTGEPMYLLPTWAAHGLEVRPRQGFGPPHQASIATAHRVAVALSRRGVRGVRGVRARLGHDDALQLVLGEVRLQPATDPYFARLRIDVVGVGGHHAVVDFLLKREPAGWRALGMRSAQSSG